MNELLTKYKCLYFSESPVLAAIKCPGENEEVDVQKPRRRKRIHRQKSKDRSKKDES